MQTFSLLVAIHALSPTASAITDGAPSTDHPAVGALVAVDSSGNGFLYCSAVLLTPGAAVSTTTCADTAQEVSDGGFGNYLLLGPSFTEQDELIEVSAWTLHPDAGDGVTPVGTDVALFTLAEDATTAPMVLSAGSQGDLAEGDPVTLVGWGTTGDAQSDSDTLRAGTALVTGSIDDFVYTSDGANWCNGDSGGAVVDDAGELIGLGQFVFNLDGGSNVCEGQAGGSSRIDLVSAWLEEQLADELVVGGGDDGTGDGGAGDGGGDEGAGDEGGKGCSALGGGSWLWGAWVGLLAVRRRRGGGRP